MSGAVAVPPRRRRRWLWRVLFGMLLLLAVVLGSGYGLLRGSLPQLDGNASVPGLREQVSLTRDALGVVDIQAGDRLDALRALGYVHAQERYFEMDLGRRQAAGELAALFGAAALPADRLHRRHRFRARAVAALSQLPGPQRRLLDAYVEGVNAGLQALPVRPWTYLLLGQAPQPWRAEDSLLVGLSMFIALDDPSGARERNLGFMAAHLPPTYFQFIARPGTRWDAPMRGGPFADPPVPGPEVIDLRSLERTLFDAPITPPRGLAEGSNQFAVSGARTGGGPALVANDMHLGLGVPNIWFRAQWQYPDPSLPEGVRRLAGATLPGVPAMVVGSNGQIAWGFTNAYGDFSDRVALVLDPADPDQYQLAAGTARIRRHVELLEVADAPAERLEVLDTDHGPVIDTDAEGRPLTLLWVAQLPEALSLGMLDLETTPDVDTALRIAPAGGTPPLNFMVGDQQGRIAWTLAGPMPARRCPADVDPCPDPSTAHDWRLPLLSTRVGARLWEGALPADRVPQLRDDGGGRMWTANARVIDGPELALLGDGGYDLGARTAQIRDGLQARERFTAQDLLDLQLDDRALFLQPWRHQLIQVLDTALADPAKVTGPRQELRRLLDDWDGRASTASVAYRLVRGYRLQVHTLVLTALAAPLRKVDPAFAWGKVGQSEGVVWQLLETRPLHLLHPRYHDWDALLLDAADQLVAELAVQPGGLAARSWGERNTTRIRHPISRALPVLGRWLDMPAQALPGDAHMPRVQGPAFGASQRLVVAPGREADGVFHMPGGQSGHPLSPFHGAGHADWALGTATPLLAGAAVHRLTLQPPP